MGNVSDKYPTEPLSEKYDASILMNYNLYSIKSIADSLGIQIDVSFKPDEAFFLNFMFAEVRASSIALPYFE